MLPESPGEGGGVGAPAVWVRHWGCQRGRACSGAQVSLGLQATWLRATLEPRPEGLRRSVEGGPDPGIPAPG